MIIICLGVIIICVIVWFAPADQDERQREEAKKCKCEKVSVVQDGHPEDKNPQLRSSYELHKQ